MFVVSHCFRPRRYALPCDTRDSLLPNPLFGLPLLFVFLLPWVFVFLLFSFFFLFFSPLFFLFCFFALFVFRFYFLSIHGSGLLACVCCARRIQFDDRALHCLLPLLHYDVSPCRSFVTTELVVTLGCKNRHGRGVCWIPTGRKNGLM